MNTMGKILVLLNLLFALAVGGFLVVDFQARRNWKAELDAHKHQLIAAGSESAENVETIGKFRQEYAKLEQKFDQVLVKHQDEIKKLNKKLSDEQAKTGQAVLTSEKEKSTRDAVEKERDRMKKETDILGTQKKKLEGLIVAMEKKNDQYLDLYQNALNDKQQFERRNEELLKRNVELEKQLARERTGPAGAATVKDKNKPNPPSFYIKGQIQKVEGTTKNLVEISLGSDHGLRIGHTLDMFRRRPQPQYIGMVRIEQVDARSAVARVVRSGVFGTLKNPRQGDEVASKIVPR